MTIELRLKRIFADQFGWHESEIHPETDLYGNLGCDSLDAVELIMAIEEEFDIQIPDEEAEKRFGQENPATFLQVLTALREQLGETTDP